MVGYHNYDHIYSCLNHLNKNPDFTIYYIDNFSKYSQENYENLKYIKKEGLIKEVILLDCNLSSNTFDRILPLYEKVIKENDYILITDGDLIPDIGFHEEQISILEKYDNVVCGSTPLKDDNLPFETFPNCASWIPSRKCEEDYCYPQGGMHMVMFKSFFLQQILHHFKINNIPFLDSDVNNYIEQMGKKWVVCKKSHSYHLTWDLYKDVNNEYTQFKIRKGFHSNDESFNYTIIS